MELTGSRRENLLAVSTYLDGLTVSRLAEMTTSSFTSSDLLALLAAAYQQTDALLSLFTLGPEMAAQNWAELRDNMPPRPQGAKSPQLRDFLEAMTFVLDLTPDAVMSMCQGLSGELDRAEVEELLDRMRSVFDQLDVDANDSCSPFAAGA